jgi:hypothetical protein
MKTLLSALLFGLIVVLTTNCGYAADDKTYDDNGVTFTYPKDWTVKPDPKPGVTSINIGNNKGAMALVQVYAPEIDPKMITGELDKTFRKVFEGKLVKDTDKPIKRKLLGEEREGMAMEFKIADNISTKLEFYAFPSPSKKHTICVTLQSSSGDADAKKLVDAIADSLMESKK